MAVNLCAIDGCEKIPANSRGWCWAHYTRWRRYGDPEKLSHAKGRTVQERFWEKADASGDGCWEWTGSRDLDGYGLFQLDGRAHRASRVSYSIAHGEIPPGMLVRHKCDNPPCVNPAHLETGSVADNSNDMVRRGRSLVGESNPAARLTATQVGEIKTLIAEGHQLTEIAARYGVTPANVGHIAAGRAWKHVPPTWRAELSQSI